MSVSVYASGISGIQTHNLNYSSNLLGYLHRSNWKTDYSHSHTHTDIHTHTHPFTHSHHRTIATSCQYMEIRVLSPLMCAALVEIDRIVALK